jgi:acyl-CoA thioester hydrolase
MKTQNSRPDLDQFARNEFRFFTPVSTRWGDCDMFGHVNNVQFLSYYETGRLDYFARVLEMNPDPNPKQSLILADIHVNFLQQIHHPVSLDVGTRISRLGNSSFDVESAIVDPADDRLYSVARATCVWFDYHKNHSVSVPKNAREIIQQFEGIPS